MLLALDWSGDPGMKPGSLPRCVMAIVACADEAAVSGALAQLRHDRGLPKAFEFHYTRANDSLRTAFMETVADQPVIATVAIYEKDHMKPQWAWGRDTDLLVQLVIHCALALPSGTLGGHKMVIDGDREAKALIKVLRPALSRALDARGRTERLNKMTSGDSAQHDAIQVADMVAGAVAEACRKQLKDTAFLGRLQENVTVLRISPEMEKPTK